MASFRYWRLTQIPQSGYVAPIAALELYDTAGGTDLTGSGVAIAKGHSGGAVANAFDRDLSTYWYDAALVGDGSSWLQYDFGAATSIEQVIVRGPATQVVYGDPFIFLVASNDLTNWSLLGDMETMQRAGGTVVTYDTTTEISSPLSARPVGNVQLAGAWPVSSAWTLVSALDSSPGNGGGTIAGEVDIAGTPNTPVARKVRAHLSSNGVLVRESWSDPVTGAYSLKGLNVAHAFYVVALDYQLNYNAVVKDNVVPT